MNLSLFGQRFTQSTGILELMEDMGRALAKPQGQTAMLGGGNPAPIPEVNRVWRRRLAEILAREGDLEIFLAQYDTPQGKTAFLKELAAFLRHQFGWPITERNIVITHGSQSGFYLLLNFFSGAYLGGDAKKIILPLAPEYIGYADQTLQPNSFRSHHPRIEVQEAPFFKYYVDFSDLVIGPEAGALCASRPTNPTGNVLTDEEVRHLAALAGQHQIPLILDNAYGAPFPQILFEPIQPYWDEQTIVSMSLSKLGLPATRTGIVVAPEPVVEALTAANAVLHLANGGMGQMLVQPLLLDNTLLTLSQTVIQPFYRAKRDRALVLTQEIFGQRFPYHLHRPQGALFLWFWFPHLPITTKELYRRLKQRGVLIVPGEYFFFGLDQPDPEWRHPQQCLRLNYARDEAEIRYGLTVLAEEVEQLST